MAFSGFQGFGDSPIQRSMTGGYGAPIVPPGTNVSQRTAGIGANAQAAEQARKKRIFDYASILGSAAGGFMGSRPIGGSKPIQGVDTRTGPLIGAMPGVQGMRF